MFFRLGANGIVNASVESRSPSKGSPAALSILSRHASENSGPSNMISCCPECMQKYEQDLAKLLACESENSEIKLEAASPLLPRWLQDAKGNDGDAKSISQIPVSIH